MGTNRKTLGARIGVIAGLSALASLFVYQAKTGLFGDRGGVLYSTFALTIPLFVVALALFLASKVVRQESEQLAKGLLWMAIGHTAGAVGELLLYGQTFVTGTEPSSPHISDFFYLFSYLCPAVGAILISRQMQKRFRWRSTLDALVIAVGGGLLLWTFALRDLWVNLSGDNISRAIAIAYPVADLIVVWGLLVLVSSCVSARRWQVSSSLLMTGTAVYAVSDVTWAFQNAQGTYSAGGVVDMGWAVGYTVIALGALRLLWRDVATKPKAEAASPNDGVRGMLVDAAFPALVGGLLLAPVLVNDVVTDGKFNVDTLVGIVILVAVISARQIAYSVWQQRIVQDLNVNLEQRVQQRTAEFEARYRLARTINGAVDLPSLLEESLPVALQTSRLDAVNLIVAPGIAPSQEFGVSIWAGRGSAECVDTSEWFEDRSPYVTGDSVLWTEQESESRCQVLRIPLRSGNEVFGSFLAFRFGPPFEPSVREQLESTTLELASGIARVIMYEKAVFAAERDYLTGLLNHRAVSQRFHRHFDDGDSAQPLGLVLLDVGNFKLLNDTHGHAIGDEVLRMIGQNLAELAGVHGVVGRTGGDEFMILLPGYDLQHSYAFGAQIQERIRHLTIRVQDHEEALPVEVNLGIASYPESSVNPYHVLGKADRNLHEAKATQVAFIPEVSREHLPVADSQSYDSLDLILTAIDNIDSYTRRHSIDVCRYATWISEELGDSADTVRSIGLAAMVHDVGKIAVPGQILRKPGSLTEEEYNVLKQHTTIGAMIVQAIPGMGEMIPGVLYHHERWDGGGYPEGLRGEEIPYMGRVIAVADALSAMTTDRPYRKGMTFEEAARRIRDGIGVQFCPVAGNAMLRILKRRGMTEDPERRAA